VTQQCIFCQLAEFLPLSLNTI